MWRFWLFGQQGGWFGVSRSTIQFVVLTDNPLDNSASCQVIASESPRSPTDLSLVMVRHLPVLLCPLLTNMISQGTAEMVQWIGGALSSIIISNLFSHSISYPISTLRGNGNLAYVAILVASAAGILRSFGLERK